MFKSVLQEVCQKRKLPVPKYTTIKDGPDHNPRFKASVLVGDLSFECPNFCTSSKEAQGDAARLACQHLNAVNFLPPNPNPGSSSTANDIGSSEQHEKDEAPTFESSSNTAETNGSSLLSADEMEISDKTRLQIYAQKAHINLPSYEHVRGDSFCNTRRFKSRVTVDKQTFECPESYNSLREAENAVAKYALLSLSKEKNVDIPFFYKNMLLKLVQNERLSSPVYHTVVEGPSHLPAFFSTVEVEGEKFVGVCAPTKKQAEQNAAKVAFQKFKERERSRCSQRSYFQVQEDIKLVTPVVGRSKVSAETQQLGIDSIPISDNDEGTETRNGIAFEIVGSDASTVADAKPVINSSDGLVSHLPASNSRQSKSELSDFAMDLESEFFVAAPHVENSTRVPIDVSEFEYQHQRENITTNHHQSSKHVISTTSTSENYDHAATEAYPFLKRTRIAIYPRTPDMVLPEGAIVMPCSDEKWLALDTCNCPSDYRFDSSEK